MSAAIGLIGLAVMGQNLALNIAQHGFKIAVHNRSTAKIDETVQRGAAEGLTLQGCATLESLVAALEQPRRILLMVKAGAAVDELLEQLAPLLDSGDVILDGGNSLYTDTQRRVIWARARELHYLGVGISGGEEGARHGPAIMPGGDEGAWPLVQPILQAIAAQVEGTPCCDWVGSDGAGHYVNMVHNGIEYGDMQLIAESYQLLRSGLGLSVAEAQAVYAKWNQGALDSYLIDITANLLQVQDADGAPLIDKILDAAGSKGTGQWTVQSALDLGVPLTLISAAVFARQLSARKEERQRAALRLAGTAVTAVDMPLEAAVQAVHDALYAAKIVSYAQGFMLLRAAAARFVWELDYQQIAGLWRGGCIIRSVFLQDIMRAYAAQSDLENLLQHEFFSRELAQAQAGWRSAVAWGAKLGLALPAMSAALSFYDGYRSATSPANLIQAQRDYFGAHTYERTDRPRGEFFHTDWATAPRRS